LQLCNSGKVAPKGFLDDDTRLIGQARGAEPGCDLCEAAIEPRRANHGR
jgi:hypothetical protein